MVAEPPSEDRRELFQHVLGSAITHGRRPTTPTVLGPATYSAIDAIASAHPEATADHIANAFDAFNDEHG